MTGEPDALALEWLAEFDRRNGRKLRVLHIGNIANNAYNNARIQRKFGIEADVLCYDYYDVMATPEWEDGGLTTTVDRSLPNWWATNLKTMRRPSWYVQGPLSLCLIYLDARCKGQLDRIWLARHRLETAYIRRLGRAANERGESWRDPRPWSERIPILSALKNNEGVSPRAVFNRMFLLFEPSIGEAFQPNIVVELKRFWQKWGDITSGISGAGSCIVYKPRDWISLGLKVMSVLGRAYMALLTRMAKWPLRRIIESLYPSAVPRSFYEREREAAAVSIRLLADEFADSDRARAVHGLFVGQIHHSLTIGPLLKHYDVVQGYSIDGLIPLANGCKAFASYEHGTLREIPFEDTLLGLICRVVYRASPAVFVTNSDVIPSVGRLKLKAEAVHFLPHAFDDQKLLLWRSKNFRIQPPLEEVVFFSPTRHHWRDSNRSFVKGNDVAIRAAAKVYAESYRFRIVMVDWGDDVGASKSLISELGLERAVTWVPTMGKQDLWRMYCSCHAVLDQFALPALGGVGFETLALGRRLITRLDGIETARFFGASPPALAGDDEDAVSESLRAVLGDPMDDGRRGEAGRRWIEDYHSARHVVAIQAAVYRDLLADIDSGQGENRGQSTKEVPN